MSVLGFDFISALAGVEGNSDREFYHSVYYTIGKVIQHRHFCEGFTFAIDSDETSAAILQRCKEEVSEKGIKNSAIYMQTDLHDGKGVYYQEIGSVVEGVVDISNHPQVLKEKENQEKLELIEKIVSDGFLVSEDYSDHCNYYYAIWSVAVEKFESSNKWVFKCLTADFADLEVEGNYNDVITAFKSIKISRLLSINTDDREWLKENNF